MLTHATVGANIQQLLHPGTCKAMLTTGTCFCLSREICQSSLFVLFVLTETFQEVSTCVLPFFHIYGMVAVMLVGMDHGAKLVTLPRFEADSFLNALYQNHVRHPCDETRELEVIEYFIEMLQPTMLQLVPPLISFLGHHPDVKLEAFDRLHTLFCGAAPLGQAAATRVIERFNKYDLLLQEGTFCCCFFLHAWPCKVRAGIDVLIQWPLDLNSSADFSRSKSVDPKIQSPLIKVEIPRLQCRKRIVNRAHDCDVVHHRSIIVLYSNEDGYFDRPVHSVFNAQ